MTSPRIPSAEETGFLMLRLAIVDSNFFEYMCQMAEDSGTLMLRGDRKMLLGWCWLVETQREGLRRAGSLKDNEKGKN